MFTELNFESALATHRARVAHIDLHGHHHDTATRNPADVNQRWRRAVTRRSRNRAVRMRGG
jgi:hypothetical protein